MLVFAVPVSAGEVPFRGPRLMLRAMIALHLIVVATLVSGLAIAHDCQAESPIWPSWRGGERHGNLPSGEYPVEWNATSKQGILWRTEIPGSGYSSPVVDDASIYLTTATVTEYTSPARLTNHWLLLAGAVACAACGASLAVKLIRSKDAPSESSGRRWMRALAILSIIAVTIGFVLFSQSFGDRGGARARGWIAHVAAAPLLLAMGAALLPPRSTLRRAASAVLLVLLGLMLVGLVHVMQMPVVAPQDPVVYLLGIPAALTKKMLGIVLISSVAIAAGAWVLVSRVAADAPIEQASQQPIWRRLVTAALAPLAIACGMALLALVVSKLAVPGTESEPVSLRSAYPTIALGTVALGALIGVVGSWIGRLPQNIALRVGLSGALALCGALLFVQFNWTPAQQRATRSIVSLDRESGSIGWQCDAFHETVLELRSRAALATPTPAISDKHIIGYFGTAGLACVDKQGQIFWTRDDVPYNSLYGVASSPLLIDDTVVVMSDGPAEFSADGEGHLWAFDVSTGEPKWHVGWPAEKSFSGNSRTPCALKHPGGTTILVWGWGWLRGVDLATGKELWKLEVPQPIIDQVASAVLDDERLVLTDQNGTRVWSRAALARGEVEELWTDRRAKANCPSPCLIDGKLYTVTDGGVASCLDANTGRALWRQRLEGEYYASVTATSEHVYFTNIAGMTTVVKTGRRFEKVAESPTGQETRASLAGFNGRLLLRGQRELICISPE